MMLARREGRLQAATAKRLEVMQSFSVGQRISLEKDGVFAMINQVKAAIADL